MECLTVCENDYRGLEYVKFIPAEIEKYIKEFISVIEKNGFQSLVSVNKLKGLEKYIALKIYEQMYSIYKTARKFAYHYNNERYERKMQRRINELYKIFGVEAHILDYYNIFAASKLEFANIHYGFPYDKNNNYSSTCFQLEVAKCISGRIEKSVNNSIRTN